MAGKLVPAGGLRHQTLCTALLLHRMLQGPPDMTPGPVITTIQESKMDPVTSSMAWKSKPLILRIGAVITVCPCSRKENTFPSFDRELSASRCKNGTMAKTIYNLPTYTTEGKYVCPAVQKKFTIFS